MATKRPGVDFRLQDGEKILRKIAPSRLAFLVWYIIGVILILAVITFPLGILLILYVEFGKVRANKFYITNKRMVSVYTFLTKRLSSVKYSQVTDIHYTQGILGRLLNYGDIHINTAGTTFMELVFFGVENPEEIEEQIEKLWQKKSHK
ncbi:MAG: PH domain-containing protein [Nanoarchaeota archaeon]|nr:PH domain-containing protein [Nanoarchaeota archaeon]